MCQLCKGLLDVVHTLQLAVRADTLLTSKGQVHCDRCRNNHRCPKRSFASRPPMTPVRKLPPPLLLRLLPLLLGTVCVGAGDDAADLLDGTAAGTATGGAPKASTADCCWCRSAAPQCTSSAALSPVALCQRQTRSHTVQQHQGAHGGGGGAVSAVADAASAAAGAAGAASVNAAVNACIAVNVASNTCTAAAAATLNCPAGRALLLLLLLLLASASEAPHALQDELAALVLTRQGEAAPAPSPMSCAHGIQRL